MQEFLRAYQSVFVLIILLLVLYMVGKELGVSMAFGGGATPAVQGMLGKMYGSF